MLEADVYSGKVLGVKWSEYTDKDTQVTIPILALTVLITANGEERKVYPSVFVDQTIIDRGAQAGKTRAQDLLETLESYGLDVDIDDVSNNDPTAWPDQLTGMELPVYCKEGEDGKVKAYLNRLGRPSLEPARVKELWGAMAGNKPVPRADSAADTGLDDDDDFPF